MACYTAAALKGTLVTELPLLETTDLYCERDDRVLFSALNWRAVDGEIWQVAGVNGAGKTTLMRILSGLHGFYDGEVRWPRWQAQQQDPRQYFLYLGHKAGLRDELTPLENIRWWTSLHGDTVDDAKIFPALACLGLAGYETVPCAQLSAGQKRRVALSLLWIMNKVVWLLDEPFTALDADGVTLIENRLREHAANGGLVIYSSHHRFDDAVRHVRLALGEVEVA